MGACDLRSPERLLLTVLATDGAKTRIKIALSRAAPAGRDGGLVSALECLYKERREFAKFQFWKQTNFRRLKLGNFSVAGVCHSCENLNSLSSLPMQACHPGRQVVLSGRQADIAQRQL